VLAVAVAAPVPVYVQEEVKLGSATGPAVPAQAQEVDESDTVTEPAPCWAEDGVGWVRRRRAEWRPSCDRPST
jgi:hypothetical protein